MMANATQELDTHINRLHSNGRLRVWSLIITFFGDAVALRGGRVGLAALQDAMALLNIEQGAVRTAMSRLAQDGWVARERKGRLSFYSLTPQGRFAFDEATRRIYSPGPPDWDGDWTIAISGGDNTTEISSRGFIHLSGPAWIKPGHESEFAPVDVLIIRGHSSDFPPALTSLWQLDGLDAAYRSFCHNWQDFRTSSLTPAQALTARTLLVHDWRRIVLRDPDLPYALMRNDWPGKTALELMRRIYTGLASQSEAWLDAAGLPQPTEPRKLASRLITLQTIAKK
ncbi:MAG: PaaX family transcriptional regulator C-terminal domain-containing protein [Anderseniella sp.]